MGKDKSETKPKTTYVYHSGDRNKRERKSIPTKLKLGVAGMDCIIKTF